MSSSPCFLDPIVIPLIQGRTVLDVACGYGRWGGLIRTNFWEAGLPHPPAVDGFDAFEANVSYCARTGAYRRVWQQVMPSPIEGQWDTVLACEFIEHLAPEQVDSALDSIERVGKRRIILSTPNFLYLRGGGNTFLGFNPYEAHLGYIARQVLVARGYRVLPAGFPNPRHPIVAMLKRTGLFRTFTRPLSAISPLWPGIANSYVAVRDL